MSVLRYFSVLRAYRDVKRFLLTRKMYELWFLALSMALTLLVIAGFAHDSSIKPTYHENIIYMQSWPANRSEAEILSQQKIDAAKKAEQEAELDRLEKQRQAEFKRLDKATSGWL